MPAGRRPAMHPARDDPRPRRRIAGGPLVVQRRACRPRDRGPPGAGGLRRRPRDGRHAGGLRRGRAGAHAVGRRRAGRAGPRRGAPRRSVRSAAAIGRGRDTASRRRATRCRRGAPRAGPPGAARPARRPAGAVGPAAGSGRAGRLGPARGSTAGGSRRCGRGRRGSSRPAWARPRPGWRRPAASLAALGPQATLERGYAIVRRRADGAILRDPAEAPAGTPLLLALAAGTLAATSDGAGAGRPETATMTRPGDLIVFVVIVGLMIAVGSPRGYDRGRPDRPDHGPASPSTRDEERTEQEKQP